ncbi:Ras-related protein Rab7 [Dendrobium catenatum]|uniref:Ras-related protein Rab7 n=1 Tax=Dendrobium catenatum TaxID=906689 RepID=A0A2I0X6T2_9ASPA|nr:Ras-related protein Rab7 [Dendrobium catenatum]
MGQDGWILDRRIERWPTFVNVEAVDNAHVNHLLDDNFQWNADVVEHCFGTIMAQRIMNIVTTPSAGADQPELIKSFFGSSLAVVVYRDKFGAANFEFGWMHKLKLHPREKFHWWRLLHDAIPTNMWLLRRGLSGTGDCPWGCGGAEIILCRVRMHLEATPEMHCVLGDMKRLDVTSGLASRRFRTSHSRKDVAGEAVSSVPPMPRSFPSISIAIFLSFVLRYVDKSFNHQLKPTINADFLTKELQIEGKLVALQIWDTPGREKFHDLALPYYRGADGCILVYDINSKKSFEALDKWYSLFMEQANPSYVSDLDHNKFPFLLLGNKIDADHGVLRQVSDKAAIDWCVANGDIPYYETSAKEGCNIEAAFLSIAQTALANQHEKHTIYFTASSSEAAYEQEQRSFSGRWFCCYY